MSAAAAGHVYRHNKTGNYYRILHLGKHTETEEDLVVYKRAEVNDQRVWVRPKNMFEDTNRFDDVTPHQKEEDERS